MTARWQPQASYKMHDKDKGTKGRRINDFRAELKEEMNG